MFTTGNSHQGSLGATHRPRHVALALAMTVVGLASVSLATLGASDETTTDDGQASSGRFESDWIYSLDLPEGWQLFSALADASGGEDLSEGPGGVSARVGGIASEPGDTVESRVAANRQDETAEGCESHASMDQPTTLGGEPAIARSWRCANSYHAAINTLEQGMRLRLRVNVPIAKEGEAADMLEALRQGFTFDAAPSEATADLAALDAQLQGTDQNEWHPIELQLALIEAAGLSLDDADPGYLGTWPLGSTSRTAVTFDDGKLDVCIGTNGGTLERGWIGTCSLIDDHTIEVIEQQSFNRWVLEFTLQDGVLTMDAVSSDDPRGLVVATGTYETLPFTRVP